MNGGRTAIGALCVVGGAAGLTLAWATAGSPRAVASHRAALLARAASVHAASAEGRFRTAIGELIAAAGGEAPATVCGVGVVPAETAWPPLVATADLPAAAAGVVTAAARAASGGGWQEIDADLAGRPVVCVAEPVPGALGGPPGGIAFAIVAVQPAPARAKTLGVTVGCALAVAAGAVLLGLGLRRG